MQMLGNSLVYKEKEVLLMYKDKLQAVKETDKQRERRALLEETDSEEEEKDALAFD